MIATAATGAALAAAGLLYGVLMVGVPYPDPTPAQAAAEQSNVAISGWVMAGGVIMFLVGIVGIGARAVARLMWPRA